MYPSLLEGQSLMNEFQIFIEAVDNSHELELAGHQQYPVGISLKLFLFFFCIFVFVAQAILDSKLVKWLVISNVCILSGCLCTTFPQKCARSSHWLPFGWNHGKIEVCLTCGVPKCA